MKSSLKISSIVLILIINFLIGILFWTIFINSGIKVFEFEFWKDIPLLLLLILFLEIFALSLLLNLKTIIIEKDKIIFQNIIFPFIKKKRLFSFYDFSKFVDEHTRYDSYETLWLFKNGKLEDRISSFYFSNYTKLKFEIKIKNKGKLKIGVFKQIYFIFGGKLN
jgi:hypothetical protein